MSEVDLSGMPEAIRLEIVKTSLDAALRATGFSPSMVSVLKEYAAAVAEAGVAAYVETFKAVEPSKLPDGRTPR